VLGHRLRHTSEQELLKPLSSVRTKHDTIGPPDRCDIEDAHLRFAFHHAGKNLLKTRGTEGLNGVAHQFLGSAMSLLDARVLLEESRSFDNVNEQNLGALGAYLRRHDLNGCVGKLRTVDREQYLHRKPPCGGPSTMAPRAPVIVLPRARQKQTHRDRGLSRACPA
jgi:hypothetical protein